MTDGRSEAERLATGESATGTRVVGIDLGQRRVGVAVSDSQRILATPHSVITRSGDPGADRRAIAGLVAQLDAGLVVVGLPLTLAGAHGPSASAAAAEAAALGTELAVPVVLLDERLTTVEADRRRRLPPEPIGARDGRGRAKARSARPSAASRARRVGIDAVAATVLLQSWLDQNRGKS